MTAPSRSAGARQVERRLAVLVFALFAVSAPVGAQVQAIDGAIDGFVRDQSRAVIAAARVSVSNVDTGLTRQTETDGSGRFRVLLVPPGRYLVECSVSGFKLARRTGLVVQAGDVLTLDVVLEAGPVETVVTVNPQLPVTRPGQIDAGRSVTAAEAAALPAVLRNPLNLVLLAPGVTGNDADEIFQPRLNANGAQMRNSFQIDGNSNTQRDRAGLRLMPISPIMVSELKVTTSGFAPEFGQASGVIVNAITPTGTNLWRGQGRADVSRPGFLARPPLLADDAPRPTTRAAVLLGSIGGPIVHDRLHLFAGYQRIRRDSSSSLITVTPADAARLNIELPPGRILDEGQTEHFAFGRLDYQPSASHRASFRLATFFNNSPLSSVSGLETPDRAVDVFARSGSGALQVTSLRGRSVNELRAQFARRVQYRRAARTTAAAPAIDIPGVASFGGPYAAVQSGNSDFIENNWQVIDNYSWQLGRHVYKAGIDVQWISDRRANTPRRAYKFSSIDNYLAAASGTEPRAYQSYLEDLGTPSIDYRTTFLSGFAQDELLIAPRVRLVYGVRYDLFGTPAARGGSPFFFVDRDNLAPRAGAAWSIDAASRTVVRASIGRVFDPPPLSLYEDALLRGKAGRVQTVLIRPRSVAAPAFPGRIGGVDQALSLVEIADDFQTQSSWLSHVQIERALGPRTALGLAYAHTAGRHLPVLVDVNLIPGAAALADGRPVYSETITAATRVDPRYDHIDWVRSIARSRYDAIIVTFRTRWRERIQVQASYTGARARDNDPLTSAYVLGSQDDRASDPANLDRDYGPTPFDQPHAFVLTAVVARGAAAHAGWTALLKETTVGLTAHVNSGLPANLRSQLDLNADAQTNDRPLGVSRNSARIGRVAYLDGKYERSLTRGHAVDTRFELSVKNLFNTLNVQQVNRVITTDATGHPLEPIPAKLPPIGTYDARRLELGLSLRF